MDIKKIHDLFLECNMEYCTDTRKLKAGAMFIALKGANFDGNKFVQQALDAGCAYAIASDSSLGDMENVIVVDDTLQTIQDLANFHRKQFKIPVLGITGTNGKTTTKELLSSVLSKKFKTLYTLGNLNNHLGVPFTLLRLRGEHEFAIIEMGANHKGDIQELCEIAEPDYGLINNIGKGHIEGFGSFEGVIQTKTEMYRYVDGHGGLLFVNENEKELVDNSQELSKKEVYGGVGLNFNLIEGEETLSLEINGNKIKTNLFGEYNANNVLTAYKVAMHFGVSEDLIKQGIEEYTPTNNRSQIAETSRGNSLILDAYNANPTSLNLALDEFIKKDGEKLCIFGDMKELGDISYQEHKDVLEKLEKEGMKAILVGMEFKRFENKYPFSFFANVGRLEESGLLKDVKGTKVLIKGSRSINLDTVEELL